MTAVQEGNDRADVRPYLKYSITAHAGLMVAMWAMLNRQISAPPQTYRIDFIGPTAGIINRELESASPEGRATSSGKIAPERRGEEFAVRAHHTRLPRPSILGNATGKATEEETAPAPAVPVAEPKTAKAVGGVGAGGAGTSVTSDLPNFPFPWYITQLRSSLWTQWSAHMPSGGGEAVVMFAILPNGQVVDLRVESSSGDQGFDFVALSAVRNAEPFPPLPGGFHEPFLKIHVRFTSQ